MNERIELLLNEIDMSPSLFADAIGVQRATISHILSGRNNPSLDFVQKVLARFPDINPDWILSGKGEIWRTAENLENQPKHEAPLKTSLSREQPELFKEGLWEEETRAAVEKKHPGQKKSTVQDQLPKQNESKDASSGSRKIDVETTGRKEMVKVLVLYNDNTFEAFTSF